MFHMSIAHLGCSILTILALLLVSEGYSLPASEYEALQDLFVSTNGTYWKWKLPYALFGYPWVFVSPAQNPCSSTAPWQGVTCSSSCGKQVCNVETIALSSYRLTGNIPPTLGNVTMLTTLTLDSNALTGSIPSSLGFLSKLSNLYLYTNHLTGSIPSSFGNLRNVVNLYLDSNNITGSIPSSFGELSKLQTMYLYSNQLTGSLPASLGSLRNLQTMYLFLNQLQGTIPSSFGNLTRLVNLYLNNNRLIGSMPEALGSLLHLQQLYLYDNQLTGSIPPSFGNLTSVTVLSLFNNQLRGSIPASLGNLSQLQNLWLYNNLLIGSIPSSLGNLESLTDLYLDHNALTGTIPSSLSKIPNLEFLWLNFNLLTGNVPSSLGNLSYLKDLYLDDNQLTGGIPMSFGMLKRLRYLFFYNNLFTGTIDALAFTSNLFLALDLRNNFFSGTTDSLANFKHFQQLLLSNNFFSGSLHSNLNFPGLELFDGSYNSFTGELPSSFFSNTSQLSVVYVDNNAFTGSIPMELFADKPNLQNVVLATNCFSHQLPATICEATVLEQLIMDGLHSATACKQRAIPSLASSGRISYDAVHGSIPSCLLALPSLSVLHMGGNSFSGTLPAVSLSNNLDELIVASNDLTGTIPTTLWYSNLTVLDLSLNRIQGTIPSDALRMLYKGNASVKLQVNQLSGKVPQAWVQLPVGNIEILQGNMFECKTNRHDLPKHDPEYNSYECGSDSTNVSLIVFMCMLVAVATFVMYLVWSKKGWQRWYEECIRICSYHGNHQTLQDELFALQRANLFIAVYALSVVLVTNGVLTLSSRSYTESYVWSVSAIYLNGKLAGSCVLVYLWMLLVLIMCICIPSTYWDRVETTRKQVVSVDDTTKDAALAQPFAWKKQMWAYALLLANTIVIMFINGLYVSAYQQHYNSATLIFIAFLISLFKMVWNGVFLGSWDTKQFLGFEIKLSDETIIGLCLFNNLITPFLSEIFVSPDCFLYIVSQAPSLTFVYSEYSCVQLGIQTSCNVKLERFADVAIRVTNTLIPSFHYSYQCSFALISNYAYVFVFRYVLSGLVNPMVASLLVRFNQSYQLLPKQLSADRSISLWMTILLQLEEKVSEDEKSDSLTQLENKLLRTGRIRQRQISRFVTDFAMLICFGALFPPLAFVIFVAISKELQEIKLALYKLHELQQPQEIATSSIYTKDEIEFKGFPSELQIRIARLQQVEIVIEKELIDAMPLIWTGVLYGLLVTVLIWAFVLFDILASTEGAGKSVWITLLMALSPSVVYCVRYAVKLCLFNRNKSEKIVLQNSITEMEMVEMTTVENPMR